MKVKDLQKALESCNPEAEVHIEVAMDHAAHIVKQYNMDENVTELYIADSVDYLEDFLAGCFETCETKFEEKW
jgi:hypothetical protein